MQLRGDGVIAAWRLHVGGVEAAALQLSAAEAWRRVGGVGVAWGLHGGDVAAECSCVGAAWRLRGGCVGAALGVIGRWGCVGGVGGGIFPSNSPDFSLHDSSIKTARTKNEAASSFCPFAPVESFLVALAQGRIRTRVSRVVSRRSYH